MTFRYPLATSSWDQAEYEAMDRVIKSNQFTMGEAVFQFEREFAAYVGSSHAVMVNSGSSANLLMIGALFYVKDDRLRLKRGDEVIVPAVSWSTTYYPLYQYGLKLKFVDIDIETLNMDLEALAAAIGPDTRAILTVNLLGNPNDFAAIQQIVGDRNILILEDNCESLGAQVHGKQAGTHGLMGTFSTFFSHHISTMEGGLVVTDNEELSQIMVSLRAHGWTRNLPDNNLVCGSKDPDPFLESFRFVLPGYNFRPLELSGALGTEQLKKLPEIVAARRRNGEALQRAVPADSPVLLQKEVGESSWFGFSLVPRKDSKLTREVLRARLEPDGFQLRPIVAGNFARNAVVEYFDHVIHGSLDNADHIDTQGLFVGNHGYDCGEMVDKLGAVIRAL